MIYKILVEERAYNNLKKLPVNISKNIISKIKNLENFSADTPNVKKLRYPLEGYRLRVGDYRILFTLESGKKILRVYTVDHRKDVYR